MKGSRKLAALASASAAVLFAAQAMAITVDGTLDTDNSYGTPLATQTINTGFGDSSYTAGTATNHDANGSELDAAYGMVENNTLYIMLTGNLENNGNLLNVFIDDGRGGSNTLQSTGGNLSNMNGSTFSPDFNPTYAIDANDYQGTFYVNTVALYSNTPENYIGADPLTQGIGSATLKAVQVGVNNTNIAGVTGVSGTAADPNAANAVTTGMEFGIPLALLGNPIGPIKIMADINGGGDTYLSNQFLPGLPTGTANVGGGGTYSLTGKSGAFNFGSVSNQYFTVTAPPALGNWISSSGGSWSDSANWSESAPNVPNAVDATANFTNSAGGNVTVDGQFTVGTMTFNTSEAGNYTLAPDSNNYALTMSVTTGDATITDFGGAHFIENNLYLASNTDVTIVNNNDLLFFLGSISGPGSLSSTNPGSYNGSYLYLSGDNTYTGGTIINSGIVQLDSSTAFPADSALTFNASDVPSPTLDLASNSITVSSISSITGPSTGPTGAMGLIIDSSGAGTVTYAGNSSNPSTFFGRFLNGISLEVASGSLTITGASTSTSNPAPPSFSGTTTIDSGATLTLAAATGGGALNQSSSITNNGTLNIDDLENVAQITNNGTISIGTGGTMQLRSGTGTITYASPGLTLNGGSIDVTNNALVLTFTPGNDPIDAIRSAFQAGLIISSTAATAPGTAVGFADGNTDTGTAAAANTILIRYTWLGDLNLDGSVTASDFNTLQANIGNSNADWAEGDLNHDEVVNADDVSLFMYGAAEAGSATIPLPEPASVALLALPLLAIRRRSIA